MPLKRKQNGKATGVKKRKNPKITKPKVKSTKSKLATPGPSGAGSTQKTDSTYTVGEVIIDAQKNKYPISCPECPKRFRFETSFLAHMKNEHSKLPGRKQCHLCPVRCPSRKRLHQHIAAVHERSMHECPYCKKQFVRAFHVERHLAQKGCDGAKVEMNPCEICGIEFTRKDNLMVHLRQQHIVKKDFVCKQCDYSSKSFSRLVLHFQNCHLEFPNRYECHYCGSVTSSRAAIIKHMEIHGDKKFSCDVCGYKTFTVEVMRRHVMTHVKEKPYKCEVCGASFIQRVQLVRHSERHSGDKACAKCGAHFPSEAEYIVHQQKKHAKIPHLMCPYKCGDEKCFKNDEDLQAHVKQHLEVKAFQCDVCNKLFSTDIGLRRHVGVHTLERARRCMYCVRARAYVRGQQLVRHVRRAHPAVFREHLAHVRQVLGVEVTVERVKASEMEAILTFLDAESDRILENYGEGVLYGGMQEAEPVTDDLAQSPSEAAENSEIPCKVEESPLMTEQELEARLRELLVKLIDREKLECFGWPHEPVDTVLEKVVESCGARAAERDKWTRVQCLRENAKQLFLYAIENKTVARMLDTNTIDQIVRQLLAKVIDD